MRRGYLSKELKLVKKKVRQISEGKAFQAEERASTDAQRHDMFG